MGLRTAVLVLSLLFPVTALAQEWQATFTPDGVAAHRLGSEKKLFLVAAGQDTDVLREATVALRQALENLPDVFVKEVGGDFAIIDDIAIAKATLTSGQADAVFVLRVFAGTPQTAVVSVMRQDGTLKRAFTGRLGTPVAGRANTAGDGASEQQLARVGEVTAEQSKTGSAAYKEKAIFIGTPVAMISSGQDEATFVVGRTQLYQGGKAIADEPSLFRAIDRPDLAESYEAVATTKRGIFIGGAVVMGAGVLMTLIGVSQVNNSSFDEEDGTIDDGLFIGGLATMGVGSIGVLISSLIDPSPVSNAELRTLVHDYNRQLRADHDIDEARGARVRLGFSSSAHGAGLRLTGTF